MKCLEILRGVALLKLFSKKRNLVGPKNYESKRPHWAWVSQEAVAVCYDSAAHTGSPYWMPFWNKVGPVRGQLSVVSPGTPGTVAIAAAEE
jgi:hypothetical protein